MKEGESAQYNKSYKPEEVVKIMKIDGNTALVKFSSGCLLATRLTGLFPLSIPVLIDSQEQLTLF